MKLLFALVAALAVAGLVYVRLAPSDPARWHVDPKAAAPGEGRFVVRPEGGDRAFGPVQMSARDLLEALDEIALATPRTIRLAGSPAEGRVTYVTRSRVFGFPDYTTVEAVETLGGTDLAIFARLRFGRGDMGVNRARIEAWLDQLRASLGT